MPAEPQDIDTSVGLIYCMAHGYLLATPDGPRVASERPCRPVRIGYR